MVQNISDGFIHLEMSLAEHEIHRRDVITAEWEQLPRRLGITAGVSTRPRRWHRRRRPRSIKNPTAACVGPGDPPIQTSHFGGVDMVVVVVRAMRVVAGVRPSGDHVDSLGQRAKLIRLRQSTRSGCLLHEQRCVGVRLQRATSQLLGTPSSHQETRIAGLRHLHSHTILRSVTQVHAQGLITADCCTVVSGAAVVSQILPNAGTGLGAEALCGPSSHELRVASNNALALHHALHHTSMVLHWTLGRTYTTVPDHRDDVRGITTPGAHCLDKRRIADGRCCATRKHCASY
mmetsp:Transcript_87648/g.234666  ORF Transcript_87648/g.234666 Transcript_87648/m.234666 type:complete len:290 (+) Transcript_87648:2365-3234(+)